jgi:Flp pilus assembly protein TadD
MARSEPNGCAGVNAGRCEQYRYRIEYIGQNCPTSQEALLASAILAFDDRSLPKAQAYLDNLLSTYRADPDAATLRGMIAIEEGNIPFALRFLGEQIQVAGDHARLREVYAAALYLDGQYSDAAVQLDRASKFGAPQWRVEYGLGLIAEALRDMAGARKHYEAALAGRPGWPLPHGRLQVLGANGK